MDMEMPSEQETGVRIYRSQELAGACVCSLQKTLASDDLRIRLTRSKDFAPVGLGAHSVCVCVCVCAYVRNV
jgi:hypothetical protein